MRNEVVNGTYDVEMSKASLHDLVSNSLRILSALRFDSINLPAAKQRAKHILDHMQEITVIVNDLLKNAGIAYISGSPIQMEGNFPPIGRSDEEIAERFKQINMSMIDLVISVAKLTKIYLDDQDFNQASSLVIWLGDCATSFL
ncbi:MAG: hypothetical protein H8D23_38345 [Candidatus Brocadiales bacterium]|nr:hypothetical protein [Candidatus Brocadiales bacterium]